MNNQLTQGSITKSLILFSIPMIIGNLLQQFYNVADTFIVGQFLGSDALAAVGSSFTLMTFLTSIILPTSSTMPVNTLNPPLNTSKAYLHQTFPNHKV